MKTSDGKCAFNADITQISLGKFQVGITGLKKAINEIRDLQGRPEAEIAQSLVDKLKPQNYIPTAAEADYKKAFLREFKKALGEKVEEEAGGVNHQISQSYLPLQRGLSGSNRHGTLKTQPAGRRSAPHRRAGNCRFWRLQHPGPDHQR